MERFWRDLTYSVRVLLKSPGFTLTAIAALALGIGANTAVFSVVNTVLLRPVPFPDPDRLVIIMNASPQGAGANASPAKYNLYRRQTAALQDISAFRANTMNLTGVADPEQLPVGQVSADFFKMLGAPVVRGRTFTAEEDLPNGGHVAVISHRFWQRRFNGADDVIGKTLSFDGQPHEIVGVLGPSFRPDGLNTFAAAPPDIFVPFQLDPNSTSQGHYFISGAKLRPGIALAAANAQMKLATDEFRTTYPKGALQPTSWFEVQRIRDVQVSGVRTSLLILLSAVTLVLLIACANVASLLLVRASVRSREMAIRAAIGAGRGRILRQLLTESLVLSFAGGIAGLALGFFGIRALLSLNPGNIPRIGIDGANVTFDWRLAAFTLLISTVTGIVFGLAPALQASRADLSLPLKEGGRSGTGVRHNKARAVLVVTEVALALVLVVGAGLLIRTFVALRAVNSGFDPKNVLVMRMSLTGPRFAPTAGVAQLLRDGTERVRAVPGVETAAATCCVPLAGGFGLPFIIAGRPLTDGPFHGGGSYYTISPDYFAAFKIPLIRGRGLTEQDVAGAAGVVVINQAMAKEFWKDADPIGQQITIGGRVVGPEFEEPPRQIVGIVGDVRDGGLNRDPGPSMYIPYAQMSDRMNALNVSITPLTWIVRSRTEPLTVSRAVQEQLRQASGGLPVARVQTMDEIVSRSTSRDAFNMLLLGVFGATALALAAIGVYGLMSYSVQQRTQEIGIRRALGAGARQVRNLVVLQGMRLSIAGVVIGLISAFAASRVLASLLFGVTARDPLVFVGVPLVLALVALLAVWLPAQRASRVDPLIALREG